MHGELEKLFNCDSRNPNLSFRIQVLRSRGWDLTLMGGHWKSATVASIVYASTCSRQSSPLSTASSSYIFFVFLSYSQYVVFRAPSPSWLELSKPWNLNVLFESICKPSLFFIKVVNWTLSLPCMSKKTCFCRRGGWNRQHSVNFFKAFSTNILPLRILFFLLNNS
jgi:hypothetical protein